MLVLSSVGRFKRVLKEAIDCCNDTEIVNRSLQGWALFWASEITAAFAKNKYRSFTELYLNCHIVLGMMMYTGAPRRAFQRPVAHEIEPKTCTRRLWLPLYGPCVISEHDGRKLLATIPALTYTLSTSAWVLFSLPVER